MQTIGERLEEARKRKGISIREAAEATKIRGDYLQKFESNQFDCNLADLYVRGFLRSYAQFLKLPADKIVHDFNALGVGSRPRAPSREVYGRMDLSVATAEEIAAQKEAATPGADEPGPAPVRRGPASFTRGGGTIPDGPSIDPALIIKGGLYLGGLLLLVLVVWGVKSLASGSHAKPEPAPVSAVQSVPEQSITLIALDTVRIKVVQDFDNKELFQGTLERGETRTLPKKGALFITASAGKNLEVELAGKRYPMPFDGYDRAKIN